MSTTFDYIAAVGMGIACSIMIVVIACRQWPQQSRATWRWLTHPVRMLALVILAIAIPAIIQHTVRTRYSYRSAGSGYTMKIDTWTGQEWIGGYTHWVPVQKRQ